MATKTTFGWASVGHFFASAFHDLSVGAKAVATATAKIDTPATQATVENLSALIPGFGSTAVALERIAFGVLGTVAGAATSVGTAADANGLNVTFDQEAIAEIRAFIAQFPTILAQAEAAFPGSVKKA